MDERQRLEALGRRRRKHRAALAGLRTGLAQAVLAAHAAGVPITEIASLANLSRPAVYAILNDRAGRAS